VLNVLVTQVSLQSPRVVALVGHLPHDHDDILHETFVIVMEAPTCFDPTKGSALSYIKSAVVPEAIRRVRAKAAHPGSRTRRQTPKSTAELSFSMPDPAPAPDNVPSAGYGSPTATEAACDAHLIWSRADSPMRLIIGSLMDGKAHVDIASDAGIDRFKVARMIKRLQSQYPDAA
jgi:RNA polymerase sigma-70 factor, ECF subfamily